MKFFLRSQIFSLILLVSISGVYAQSSPQKKEILQKLNSFEPGKGRVKVYEDESVTQVLGRPMGPPRTVYATTDGATQFYRVRGYKIQAFSGNDQRTSKNEAMQKQQQINNAYPDLETVVLFESPFWRLRVGNFEHRDDAEVVLKEMAKSFPSFGKEMYIVVDEVKIPVHPVFHDEQ